MTPLMTVKEVAKVLRKDPLHIRRYARTGVIKASKIGQCWMFRQSDIDAFIDSNDNSKLKVKNA